MIVEMRIEWDVNVSFFVGAIVLNCRCGMLREKIYFRVPSHSEVGTLIMASAGFGSRAQNHLEIKYLIFFLKA